MSVCIRWELKGCKWKWPNDTDDDGGKDVDRHQIHSNTNNNKKNQLLSLAQSVSWMNPFSGSFPLFSVCFFSHYYIINMIFVIVVTSCAIIFGVAICHRLKCICYICVCVSVCIVLFYILLKRMPTTKEDHTLLTLTLTYIAVCAHTRACIHIFHIHCSNVDKSVYVRVCQEQYETL